ncbi:MAG TPA: DUF1684 domain-containing protein [Chryseosolibacter sp.]
MIGRTRFSKSGVVAVLLTFCFITGYTQDDVLAKKEIEDHRKEQENEMRDKEKSPLLPKDRKKFKHLNYYPIDLKYRVRAKFVRTENEPLFRMKTTTTRLPEYVKYGEVHFTLDGQAYKLNVYQSPEIMKRPGYEDYLFIPFTDKTNGKETYDVGRYIEFRIPTSEDVIVDFNQNYNPYCSYNHTYSCPIPPAENDLPIEIPAGEKKFH